jgi:hypothetical protein
MKCFAQMANRFSATTFSMSNLARIMDDPADLQKPARSLQATAQLGMKCPGFVWTRWGYMFDTL